MALSEHVTQLPQITMLPPDHSVESRRDYRRAVNVSRAAEIAVNHNRSGNA